VGVARPVPCCIANVIAAHKDWAQHVMLISRYQTRRYVTQRVVHTPFSPGSLRSQAKGQ
jgi:hypothetical protein